jgi:hypothetical protein
MTSPRPQPTPAPADQKPKLKDRLDLSFSQVIAGAMAAVTSAVAASYFGVAGTLLGAAVGSIIATVGTSIYKASLRKTNEKLRKVIPVQALSQLKVVPHPTDSTRPAPPAPSPIKGAGAPRPADETTIMQAISDTTVQLPADSVNGADVKPRPTRWLELLRQLRWQQVAIVAALVFVLGTGVVVATELIGGGSLWSILHGKPDGSTSIGGGRGTAPPQPTNPTPSDDGPAPTPSTDLSPSVSPSVTPSHSPSPTPSSKPSPTPSTPTPTVEPTTNPSAPVNKPEPPQQ